MLSKQDITVSRGRSLIGREGVLIADFPQSYPSSRAEATLVMTDMWPSAPRQGILNSPKIKYLGGDAVSGKAVHAWHFFSKNLFFFQNDLPNFDSLVQIKNRDNLRVLNCSKPNMNRTGLILPGHSGTATDSGDSTREKRA